MTDTAMTVLVTGANRGIGLEFCRQYLAEGASVIACCRSPETASSLLALQQSNRDRLQVFPFDVTNAAQREALAQALNGERIDVLINNAGIYGPDKARLGHLDKNEWLKTIEINCIAPIQLIESLLDNVAASTQKTIVSITSKMASMADNLSGGSYIYRTSKAALNAAMKSVAVDLKQKKVIAVVIHPGWVKTDMGGPNAQITVAESVTAMKTIISRLSLTDSGQFFDVDGTEIPW